MPEIKSPFLTADEAAAWLRTTAAALAQKRQRGCGPPYCQPDGPNTKVLYRLSDLEEWASKPREDAGEDGIANVD